MLDVFRWFRGSIREWFSGNSTHEPLRNRLPNFVAYATKFESPDARQKNRNGLSINPEAALHFRSWFKPRKMISANSLPKAEMAAEVNRRVIIFLRPCPNTPDVATGGKPGELDLSNHPKRKKGKPSSRDRQEQGQQVKPPRALAGPEIPVSHGWDFRAGCRFLAPAGGWFLARRASS